MYLSHVYFIVFSCFFAIKSEDVRVRGEGESHYANPQLQTMSSTWVYSLDVCRSEGLFDL
jgi:hypothetical protein